MQARNNADATRVNFNFALVQQSSRNLHVPMNSTQHLSSAHNPHNLTGFETTLHQNPKLFNGSVADQPPQLDAPHASSDPLIRKETPLPFFSLMDPHHHIHSRSK